MEDSILITIKKMLGISAEDKSFDTDIITDINSCFSILAQLGVGPDDGFSIIDETSKWNEFVDFNDNQLNQLKSYMYAKVRLMFDPPSASVHVEAFKQLINEFEWRLNVAAERKRGGEKNE